VLCLLSNFGVLGGAFFKIFLVLFMSGFFF
jgi:hypothetical protein